MSAIENRRMTIRAFSACCLPAFALQPIAGSRLTGHSVGQAGRGGDGKIRLGANGNKGLAETERKSIHRMDVRTDRSGSSQDSARLSRIVIPATGGQPGSIDLGGLALTLFLRPWGVFGV
jgi:hypothetical protein